MTAEEAPQVAAGVPVAAGRVGLPDLDQGVGDGATVAVQDPALDDDPLPQRLPAVLDGQVVIALGHPALAEQRPRDLGQPVRQRHQRRRGMP